MKKLFNKVLSSAVALAGMSVLAAPPPDEGDSTGFRPPSEFEMERMAPRLEMDALAPNFAGENISLADGGLSFSVTDISLKSNMSLPIQITRTYQRLAGQNDMTAGEFGDWQLDLPRISGTALNGDTRYTPNYYADTACSNLLAPGPIRAALGNNVEQHEYWNGADLTIPGIGGGKIMSSTLADYQTKDHQLINCAVNASGNEYFVVKTPDGTKYTMAQRREIQGKALHIDFKSAGRKQIVYLVTEIEDRYGNKQHFDYEGNGLLSKVSIIQVGKANEEMLDVDYVDGQISAVYTHPGQPEEEVWRYEYQGQNLSKVYRPDNKFWLYEFPQYGWYAATPSPDPTAEEAATPYCLSVFNGSSNGGDTLKVTHPDGAKAEFDFHLLRHGRTEVPAYSVTLNSDKPIYNINSCYTNLGIKEKRLINGNNVHAWRYEFSNELGHWDISLGDAVGNHAHYGVKGPSEKTTTCSASPECAVVPDDLGYEQADLRVLTITNPDNSKAKHYVSKRWDHTDGSIVATEIYGAGEVTPVQTVIKHFDVTASRGISGVNDGIQTANSATLSRANLLAQQVTRQLGNSYIINYTRYNQYDRVLEENASNSFNGKSRYIRYGYEHDTDKWILNQPTTTEVSATNGNYVTAIENIYYAKSHALYPFYPYQQKSYGRWQKQFSSYHADGNTKKVEFNAPLTFGSGNRYLEYNDYYRGVARSVKQPSRESADTQTLNRTVDANGRVTSITDFNGTPTEYGYDDIGRLAWINLANDPAFGVNWADTLITWSTNASAQPVRTITNCELNGSKTDCLSGTTQNSAIETYDNLFRLQLTERTAPGMASRYQRFEYDFEGKQTFASLVSHSSIETKGTSTTFDALGRQDIVSTSGLGSVDTDYLADNKIRVTDALGNQTTTTYLAYGSPGYGQATKIESPEEVTTDIVIDVFGLTRSVSQTGRQKDGRLKTFTESYQYDAYKQWCFTSRPDVGNTLSSHNALGEVLWMAQGVSNSGCSTTKPTSAVTYKLDNQGDVYQAEYTNGPDLIYRRDANGNILTLISGTVRHQYSYNNQNLLEDETLNIGPEKTFELDYGFHPTKARTYLTYPDGTNLQYSLNGFGEPTDISSVNDGVTVTFASNIKFHSNGSLQSFTYGNGVVHNTQLDASSWLPKQIKDTGPFGSSTIPTTVMDLTYSYDNNANIKSIVDGQNSLYSITDLSYDGLDRLTATTGNSSIGSSQISYDGFGNIIRYASKNTDLDYHYDYSTNRLTSAVTYGTSTKVRDFSQSGSYDSRGNVLKNGKDSFVYNDANQLTATADGNSYLYDGYDRRVSHSDDIGTEFSVYSADGTLLYRETDVINGQGKPVNYIYLGKKLIAKYGEVSPSATVEASRQHYKPFGGTVETAKVNDIGYTGHKFDTDLGLSYMQARYYDPVIGRFYANDPIGFRDVYSFNRYTYANNNPYKYIDPDGRKSKGALLGDEAIKAAGEKFIDQFVNSAGDQIISGKELNAWKVYSEASQAAIAAYVGHKVVAMTSIKPDSQLGKVLVGQVSKATAAVLKDITAGADITSIPTDSAGTIRTLRNGLIQKTMTAEQHDKNEKILGEAAHREENRKANQAADEAIRRDWVNRPGGLKDRMLRAACGAKCS